MRYNLEVQGSRFKVQGSRFKVQGSGLVREAGRPLITNERFTRMRNEELGMRNEGGGFAANIYGVMPEGSI